MSTKKVLGRTAGALAPQLGAAARRPATTVGLRPVQHCCTAVGQQHQQQQTRSFFSKEESKSVYEYGAHRSDAEARIAKVPVVQVEGSVALCDGGERGSPRVKVIRQREVLTPKLYKYRVVNKSNTVL